MPDYDYLIIGGGMTADAAAHGIHEADPAGSVGIIGAEPHPPYDRPPLSKALWKGEPEEKIWRKTKDTGAALEVGRWVTAIDPRGHGASDDRGTTYRFKKLLLATGGTPRRLPLKTDQIIYFRTLDDYRRLHALAAHDVRFLVMGGAFIGSEVAAALRMQGRNVTMLVPEAGVGARVFPTDLSAFLVDYYRQKGVTMRMGEGMAGRGPAGGGVVWSGHARGRGLAWCGRPPAASSSVKSSSPDSASSPASSSRRKRGWTWTMASWWTSSVARAIRTSMPRATWPTS